MAEKMMGRTQDARS